MGHITYRDHECSDVTCHFNGNHILAHPKALGFALKTFDLRKLGIGNLVSTNSVSPNQTQSNEMLVLHGDNQIIHDCKKWIKSMLLCAPILASWTSPK